MPVTKRTRYEVLKRDNHTCRYCGATAPDAILTVDHVTPVALGGSDDPSNLVAACRDCNYGKASTSPDASMVDDVAQDAIRWAAAIAKAAAILSAETEERFALNADFNQLWTTQCTPYVGKGWCWRADDWAETLDLFRGRGLSQGEIVDAFWIMMGKKLYDRDKWKYFCGICWRKIDRIQETAKALLETEGDA